MAISLDYYDGANLMKKGDIRISASSIARYITDRRAFFGELLLNEQGFTGSTASTIGTLTHGFAEAYVVDGTVNGEQMEDYIDAQAASNPEVDASVVRDQYPIMGSKLINDYVIPNPPSFVEEFMLDTVLPATGTYGAVMVGGSCDAVNVPGVAYTATAASNTIGSHTQATIIDYKTTSATSLPENIPYAYKLQLLTYAYLYSKRGIHADRIRIVYVTRNNVGRVSQKTGKPLKQYPTQVAVLTQSITEQDYEYIEGLITVIAKSIRLWHTNPELRDVIAGDSRLV